MANTNAESSEDLQVDARNVDRKTEKEDGER